MMKIISGSWPSLTWSNSAGFITFDYLRKCEAFSIPIPEGPQDAKYSKQKSPTTSNLPTPMLWARTKVTSLTFFTQSPVVNCLSYCVSQRESTGDIFWVISLKRTQVGFFFQMKINGPLGDIPGQERICKYLSKDTSVPLKQQSYPALVDSQHFKTLINISLELIVHSAAWF